MPCFIAHKYDKLWVLHILKLRMSIDFNRKVETQVVTIFVVSEFESRMGHLFLTVAGFDYLFLIYLRTIIIGSRQLTFSDLS